MKKLLLNLILPVLSLTVSANPISQSEALNIAKRMTVKMHKPSVALSVSGLQNEAKDRSGQRMQNPPYYAFNYENNNGFVIVAGDDLFPSILGYSEQGSIPDSADELPCCLRFFLDSYSEFICDVRAGKANAPQKAHGESDGNPMMNPLLTCKWGQDTPFNLYCPSNETLGQSIVGCVATAIAQIMYKWKWPETGKGYINYTNDYGNTTVDLSQSTYNWSIMKDTYGKLDAKKESGKAVARLSYDCGVALYMSYGSKGSGTYTEYALQALYKNFSYKASSLDYLRRECCNSTQEFHNTIISELRKGRPVLFSASSSTESDADVGGHAFVIDGYDSTNFLHVNWGWNGTANGYYDVDVMDASNYQFNIDQDIIFGIEPDYACSDISPKQHRLYFRSKPYVSVPSVMIEKEFNININNFYNHFPYDNSYYLGIGLYNYEGNLLEIISETPREYMSAWFGYTEYKLKCNIPKKYDNDAYILRMISRMEDFSDWILVDMVGGSEKNKIPIVISNGTIRFNQVPTEIETLTDEAHIIRTEHFTLNGQAIHNTQNVSGVIIERRILSDGTIRTVKWELK